MESINFYCLIEHSNKTICKLLEKCYHTGNNIVVLVPDIEFQEILNQALWSFGSVSFIPHGSSNDADSNNMPIYITAELENPNKSEILVVINVDKIDYDYVTQFNKVLIVFSMNNSSEKLQNFREMYIKFKQLGYIITYFQQNDQLQWVAKK